MATASCSLVHHRAQLRVLSPLPADTTVLLLGPLKPSEQAEKAPLPQPTPALTNLVAPCWAWIYQHLSCTGVGKSHRQIIEQRGTTTLPVSWLCSHWCSHGYCWPPPLPRLAAGSVQLAVCQDLQLLSAELVPSLHRSRGMVRPSCRTLHLSLLDFMTVLLAQSWLSRCL